VDSAGERKGKRERGRFIRGVCGELRQMDLDAEAFVCLVVCSEGGTLRELSFLDPNAWLNWFVSHCWVGDGDEMEIDGVMR
jgi:hypothetical protein